MAQSGFAKLSKVEVTFEARDSVYKQGMGESGSEIQTRVLVQKMVVHKGIQKVLRNEIGILMWLRNLNCSKVAEFFVEMSEEPIRNDYLYS